MYITIAIVSSIQKRVHTTTFFLLLNNASYIPKIIKLVLSEECSLYSGSYSDISTVQSNHQLLNSTVISLPYINYYVKYINY